ncbi:MAG TPA: adenosine deaminase [Pseudomonadota bacterium]|nr:adenosine deaminase [Pseudomonadota bacterium]
MPTTSLALAGARCLALFGLGMTLGATSSVAAQPFSQRFEEIKKQAGPGELYRLLFELPKGGDLHHHINLSIPAEMWLAGATDPRRLKGNRFYTRVRLLGCAADKPPFVLQRTIQQASFQKLDACQKSEYVPLDQLDAEGRQKWLSGLKLDRPEEGRDEFFDALGARLGELTRDANLVTELMVENLRQYAAEKTRYIEMQVVGPRFNDQQGAPIPLEQGARLLGDRLQQPDAKAVGVTVRFLAAVVRFQPDAEQQLERAYALVAQHRELWVGINLTGKEEIPAGHGLRFVETLRKLRRSYSNVAISVHAGESDAPGREVRTALLLGASRVGHAVNLLSDPDTLILMRNSRYLIEINLLSNLLLGYVPNLASHPFSEYLRLGIPVCLNTDDRTAWDSNLTDEYYAAVSTFNLSWEEVVKIGENSLTHAFAEPATRASLLKDYQAALGTFERTYSTDDWRDRLRRVTSRPSGYARREWGIQ